MEKLFNIKSFLNKYKKSLSLEGIDTAILCFSSSTAKKLSLKESHNKVRALGNCYDIYPNFKKVIVSQFGYGAPSAILQMEYLKSLGIKNFYSLGTACSLSSNLEIGEAIHIQEAYKKTSDELSLVKNPKSLDNFKNAVSLTTDFPFQETKKDYENYLSKEISCLEMEAYNLIKISQEYDLKMHCLACISDIVTDSNWQLHFSDDKVQERLLSSLETLLKMN